MLRRCQPHRLVMTGCEGMEALGGWATRALRASEIAKSKAAP